MTERLARFSAAHAKRVVTAWLVAAAVGAVLAGALLFPNLTSEQRMTNDPESYVGAQILRERLPDPQPVDELVVVRNERLTADDPAFRRFVADVAGEVATAKRERVRVARERGQ